MSESSERPPTEGEETDTRLDIASADAALCETRLREFDSADQHSIVVGQYWNALLDVIQKGADPNGPYASELKELDDVEKLKTQALVRRQASDSPNPLSDCGWLEILLETCQRYRIRVILCDSQALSHPNPEKIFYDIASHKVYTWLQSWSQISQFYQAFSGVGTAAVVLVMSQLDDSFKHPSEMRMLYASRSRDARVLSLFGDIAVPTSANPSMAQSTVSNLKKLVLAAMDLPNGLLDRLRRFQLSSSAQRRKQDYDDERSKAITRALEQPPLPTFEPIAAAPSGRSSGTSMQVCGPTSLACINCSLILPSTPSGTVLFCQVCHAASGGESQLFYRICNSKCAQKYAASHEKQLHVTPPQRTCTLREASELADAPPPQSQLISDEPRIRQEVSQLRLENCCRPQDKSTPQTADVVIIGSGVAALTAAATLLGCTLPEPTSSSHIPIRIITADRQNDFGRVRKVSGTEVDYGAKFIWFDTKKTDPTNILSSLATALNIDKDTEVIYKDLYLDANGQPMSNTDRENTTTQFNELCRMIQAIGHWLVDTSSVKDLGTWMVQNALVDPAEVNAPSANAAESDSAVAGLTPVSPQAYDRLNQPDVSEPLRTFTSNVKSSLTSDIPMLQAFDLACLVYFKVLHPEADVEAQTIRFKHCLVMEVAYHDWPELLSLRAYVTHFNDPNEGEANHRSAVFPNFHSFIQRLYDRTVKAAAGRCRTHWDCQVTEVQSHALDVHMPSSFPIRVTALVQGEIRHFYAKKVLLSVPIPVLHSSVRLTWDERPVIKSSPEVPIASGIRMVPKLPEEFCRRVLHTGYFTEERRLITLKRQDGRPLFLQLPSTTMRILSDKHPGETLFVESNRPNPRAECLPRTSWTFQFVMTSEFLLELSCLTNRQAKENAIVDRFFSFLPTNDTSIPTKDQATWTISADGEWAADPRFGCTYSSTWVGTVPNALSCLPIGPQLKAFGHSDDVFFTGEAFAAVGQQTATGAANHGTAIGQHLASALGWSHRPTSRAPDDLSPIFWANLQSVHPTLSPDPIPANPVCANFYRVMQLLQAAIRCELTGASWNGQDLEAIVWPVRIAPTAKGLVDQTKDNTNRMRTFMHLHRLAVHSAHLFPFPPRKDAAGDEDGTTHSESQPVTADENAEMASPETKVEHEQEGQSGFGDDDRGIAMEDVAEHESSSEGASGVRADEDSMTDVQQGESSSKRHLSPPVDGSEARKRQRVSSPSPSLSNDRLTAVLHRLAPASSEQFDHFLADLDLQLDECLGVDASKIKRQARPMACPSDIDALFSTLVHQVRDRLPSAVLTRAREFNSLQDVVNALRVHVCQTIANSEAARHHIAGMMYQATHPRQLKDCGDLKSFADSLTSSINGHQRSLADTLRHMGDASVHLAPADFTMTSEPHSGEYAVFPAVVSFLPSLLGVELALWTRGASGLEVISLPAFDFPRSAAQAPLAVAYIIFGATPGEWFTMGDSDSTSDEQQAILNSIKLTQSRREASEQLLLRSCLAPSGALRSVKTQHHVYDANGANKSWLQSHGLYAQYGSSVHRWTSLFECLELALLLEKSVETTVIEFVRWVSAVTDDVLSDLVGSDHNTKLQARPLKSRLPKSRPPKSRALTPDELETHLLSPFQKSAPIAELLPPLVASFARVCIRVWSNAGAVRIFGLRPATPVDFELPPSSRLLEVLEVFVPTTPVHSVFARLLPHHAVWQRSVPLRFMEIQYLLSLCRQAGFTVHVESKTHLIKPTGRGGPFASIIGAICCQIRSAPRPLPRLASLTHTQVRTKLANALVTIDSRALNQPRFKAMVDELKSECPLESIKIPGDHLLTSDDRVPPASDRQSVAQWLSVIKRALEQALDIELVVVDVETERRTYIDSVIDQKPFLFHTRLDLFATTAAPRLFERRHSDRFPVFLATTSLRCEHICLHPSSVSLATAPSLPVGPMDSATDPNQWFLDAWKTFAVLVASMPPTPPPVGTSVDVDAMVESAALCAGAIAAGRSILDTAATSLAAQPQSQSPQVNVDPASSRAVFIVQHACCIAMRL